ncbi:MAG: hypothetical protein ACYCTZ_15090 [Candidatus Dormibacteria bacterium]
MLEFHDVVTRHFRTTDSGSQQYDQTWLNLAIGQTMRDLAEGRLVIRRTPPKAAEHAMELVTLAARNQGHKFAVWDALHLITASEWAFDLGAPIELWTTDTDYTSFLRDFPAFATRITVVNLDE